MPERHGADGAVDAGEGNDALVQLCDHLRPDQLWWPEGLAGCYSSFYNFSLFCVTFFNDQLFFYQI